jgi:protein required for attachment to host cells
MRKRRTWYVIADGGRARFVERDEQGAYRTVSSFVSTELKASSRDLGTERPGRVHESATTARHAIEPKTDPKEAAKEDFIRYVAEQVQSAQENYDDLVLVAPPRVLGQLRETLAQSVADAVTRDLAKDLTKVPDHELSEHLAKP